MTDDFEFLNVTPLEAKITLCHLIEHLLKVKMENNLADSFLIESRKKAAITLKTILRHPSMPFEVVAPLYYNIITSFSIESTVKKYFEESFFSFFIKYQKCTSSLM